MFTKIFTKNAPEPLGPYSQAVIDEDNAMVYVSMQLPIIMNGSHIDVGATEPVAVQTGHMMDNIEAILKSAGASMRSVVKVTLYLIDLNDGRYINPVYEKYFSDILPARSIVNVASLPLGFRVAADVIAKKL